MYLGTLSTLYYLITRIRLDLLIFIFFIDKTSKSFEDFGIPTVGAFNLVPSQLIGGATCGIKKKYLYLENVALEKILSQKIRSY